MTVNEKGKDKKMFGWHVSAHGKKYHDFLTQFLPALTKYLLKHRLKSKTIFHVSDEPELRHLASYRKAALFVKPFLKGFKVVDALSSIEFYKQGLVETPVPCNDHIEAFIKEDIKERWTYYCCCQTVNVPNRFFHFPSARNRIMGFLMYKYNIHGFLHWGYNFWHSQFSIAPIDPFRVTDAGLAFPSGDAFLVYPGEKGPIDSIRHEVFREALQDLRALQALEKKISREKTIQLLERGLKKPLKMDDYPRDPAWLLKKRDEILKRL